MLVHLSDSKPVASLFSLSLFFFFSLSILWVFLLERDTILGTVSASLIKNTIARMPSARWSISLFDINNERWEREKERKRKRVALARLPLGQHPGLLDVVVFFEICAPFAQYLSLPFAFSLSLPLSLSHSLDSNHYNGPGRRDLLSRTLPVETFLGPSSEKMTNKNWESRKSIENKQPGSLTHKKILFRRNIIKIHQNYKDILNFNSF